MATSPFRPPLMYSQSQGKRKSPKSRTSPSQVGTPKQVRTSPIHKSPVHKSPVSNVRSSPAASASSTPKQIHCSPVSGHRSATPKSHRSKSNTPADIQTEKTPSPPPPPVPPKDILFDYPSQPLPPKDMLYDYPSDEENDGCSESELSIPSRENSKKQKLSPPVRSKKMSSPPSKDSKKKGSHYDNLPIRDQQAKKIQEILEPVSDLLKAGTNSNSTSNGESESGTENQVPIYDTENQVPIYDVPKRGESKIANLGAAAAAMHQSRPPIPPFQVKRRQHHPLPPRHCRSLDYIPSDHESSAPPSPKLPRNHNMPSPSQVRHMLGDNAINLSLSSLASSSEISRSDPAINYDSSSGAYESEYDNYRPGMASDEDYFIPEPVSDMDIDFFDDIDIDNVTVSDTYSLDMPRRKQNGTHNKRAAEI